MIVPSPPPRQRRILERWNPSTPLAQITKHRNSWRITTKKKKNRQEVFSLPIALFPPRSFFFFFWKGMKVKILLIKVWLSLPHPVTGDTARVCWTIRRANVDSCVVATASKRGGGAGEDWVFSLRLPAFGAGDESERRWRCGCRCLDLQRSVSQRRRGTGVALLWARRSQSPLEASESGMVPIRMERANICLTQKNPD